MFKYDSPVMQALSEFTDFMVLNILFAICCIPVFTIGAAFSARFYVGMKLVTGTDEGIIKPFFKSFVSNLKQTLPINIVAVLLIIFFSLDFHFIYVLQMAHFFYYIIGFIVVLLLMTLWFSFALIARYVMQTKAVLKSALLLTISHFIRVLIAVAFALAPFVLSYWFFTWAWLIWLILESIMLMPNCRFLVKTFDKIEIAQGLKPDSDADDDSEESYDDILDIKVDSEEDLSDALSESVSCNESQEDKKDNKDKKDKINNKDKIDNKKKINNKLKLDDDKTDSVKETIKETKNEIKKDIKHEKETKKETRKGSKKQAKNNKVR